MSKKPWPNSYLNLPYKIGQDFFDICMSNTMINSRFSAALKFTKGKDVYKGFFLNFPSPPDNEHTEKSVLINVELFYRQIVPIFRASAYYEL